jgi:hypothetical protein
MRYTLLLTGLVLTLSLSTGCATVVRGDKQKVIFETEPQGAKLIVDGKDYTTPAAVVLKRKEKKGTASHEITVSKDGYQTITFKFESHWDAGGAGAVVIDAAVPGGSALFLIDLITGADHNYNKIATIKLLPVPPGPTPTPLTLYEYKGKLLEKPAYDAAVEKDRLFKENKKKSNASTQPSK